MEKRGPVGARDPDPGGRPQARDFWEGEQEGDRGLLTPCRNRAGERGEGVRRHLCSDLGEGTKGTRVWGAERGGGGGEIQAGF